MAWTETINFANDAMNARSRDAFAIAYGYQATIDGAPNPETKGQFRARMLKEHIKTVTRDVERRALVEAVATPTVND